MDDRIKKYENLIRAFADRCDGIIYHYTSCEGFRGIIENSEIWLTNTEFVNDTTECKALQEKKDLFSDDEFENDFVRDAWKKFINNPDTSNNTYIASFSRGKKESLEQWRAYGNFRIGFEAKKLIFPPFNLYKCVYSRDRIREWILQKSKLKEWDTDNINDNDQYKRGAAFHLIYAASRMFKNEYFKNEKEVRIITVSHTTWDPYHKSPSMFKKDRPIYYRPHPIYKIPVPYVKLIIPDPEKQEKKEDKIEPSTPIQMKESKLEEEKNIKRKLLPIKEILIGPMLHKKEAEIACEILLRDKGYKDTKLEVSNIPYRGF
ncbi:MAG: DUF2971 domain-containing protein [Thermodesulfobacteriota bacterium]